MTSAMTKSDHAAVLSFDSESKRGVLHALAPMQADIPSLVLLATKGDRAASETLYRLHAADLLRTVTRLLGSSADADDIVQDTFVDAFEGLSGLREPAAFRGWLKSIAVHKVRRRIRRRSLMRKVGLDRTVEDATLETLAATTAPVDARSELRSVDRALAKMDADVRIAWMLRMVDGEALSDIAEVCGCSLATAKRRIAMGDALVRMEGAR